MKDLDFDELDRAVNSAMADSSGVNNTTITDGNQASNPVQSASQDNSTPIQKVASQNPSLAGRRTSAKVMDVVRPTTSTPVNKTPISTQPVQPVQAQQVVQAASPTQNNPTSTQTEPISQPIQQPVQLPQPEGSQQPVDEDGNNLPVNIVVKQVAPPSAPKSPAETTLRNDQIAPTNNQANIVPAMMPERVSRQGMTLNPISTSPVVPDEPEKPKITQSNGAQHSVTDWPDPIDFHNANIAKETENIQEQVDNKQETASNQIAVPSQTGAEVAGSITKDQPDDIDKISDDIAKSLGQKDDNVLDSPFIPNTKVEKRPLGAFSADKDELGKVEEKPLVMMPKQFNSEAPLPAELQDELLMIEASEDLSQPDDIPIKDDESEPIEQTTEQTQEPLNEAQTNPPIVQAPPVINTPPIQPLVISQPQGQTPQLNSQTAQPSEQPQKEEKIDPATINPELNTIQIPPVDLVSVDRPLGSASISQQYKEKSDSKEPKTVAIYDTDSYHKPLKAIPKKNNWMIFVWISLLIVAGIGVGVLVYYFAVPH